MVELDLSDRDQRQAQVAHLREQAMERGLVDDRTMDDGGAVAVAGEDQPVEPGRPAGAEVPLDADLVPAGAVPVAGRRVGHRAPFPCWWTFGMTAR
jgi:hypothetical protein